MDAKLILLARMNVSLIGMVEVGGVPCSIPTDLLIRHGRALTLMNQVQKEFEILLSTNDRNGG